MTRITRSRGRSAATSYYPGTEEAHILTRRASEGSALKPSLARRVGIWKDAELSCRGNRLHPRSAQPDDQETSGGSHRASPLPSPHNSATPCQASVGMETGFGEGDGQTLQEGVEGWDDRSHGGRLLSSWVSVKDTVSPPPQVYRSSPPVPLRNLRKFSQGIAPWITDLTQHKHIGMKLPRPPEKHREIPTFSTKNGPESLIYWRFFCSWTRPASNAITARRDWRFRWVPARRDCSCQRTHARAVPHRTTLESREAWRFLRSLPPDLPGLSSRDLRGYRSCFNQVLPATGLVDDAVFPSIRRRVTDSRLRYNPDPDRDPALDLFPVPSPVL